MYNGLMASCKQFDVEHGAVPSRCTTRWSTAYRVPDTICCHSSMSVLAPIRPSKSMSFALASMSLDGSSACDTHLLLVCRPSLLTESGKNRSVTEVHCCMVTFVMQVVESVYVDVTSSVMLTCP